MHRWLLSKAEGWLRPAAPFLSGLFASDDFERPDSDLVGSDAQVGGTWVIDAEGDGTAVVVSNHCAGVLGELVGGALDVAMSDADLAADWFLDAVMQVGPAEAATKVILLTLANGSGDRFGLDFEWDTGDGVLSAGTLGSFEYSDFVVPLGGGHGNRMNLQYVAATGHIQVFWNLAKVADVAVTIPVVSPVTLDLQIQTTGSVVPMTLKSIALGAGNPF